MHLRAETIWIIQFFPVILNYHIAGGRSVCWTPRLEIKFMVLYGVNIIFSIVWDLGFYLLLSFFFSCGNSRVGSSHNSQILAVAALRILLIPEAANKSYQPPFLLITKYSTVSLICTLSSPKKLWLMFSISLC